VNGSPVAFDQWVPLSSLNGVAYTGGPTAANELISLEAYNGNWSNNGLMYLKDQGIGQTVTIGAGATLELTSAYSGTVTFAGSTGTLKLDRSSTFTGKIGGQLATGDIIDLADITAGAGATIGYSGNNSPGTLTVSDGTHTAHIALLGNYMAANFVASSDGHGGTSVVDPPISSSSQVPLLTAAHA
jgi:hypothetical protein